jgi:hypothetical protein
VCVCARARMYARVGICMLARMHVYVFIYRPQGGAEAN